MSGEALKELRKKCINNVGYKNYPSMGPAINTTDLHIKIYELIDEYVGLHEDLKRVGTHSSKAFIQTQMRNIETELVSRFWIVEGDKMEPRQKEEKA